MQMVCGSGTVSFPISAPLQEHTAKQMVNNSIKIFIPIMIWEHSNTFRMPLFHKLETS